MSKCKASLFRFDQSRDDEASFCSGNRDADKPL